MSVKIARENWSTCKYLQEISSKFEHFTNRKKHLSKTPSPQTNQLTSDGPYYVTVGAGQPSFADVNNQEVVYDETDNHTNESFQTHAIPTADTGIYHEIKDATNEHAYATVHPYEPSQEDEDNPRQLHEETRRQIIGETRGDSDHESEEGWVDNNIYISK